MSKPLELTIYPPVSRFTRELVDYNIEQGCDPYFGISAEMHAPGLLAMKAKHLTFPELAAEMHAATLEWWGLQRDGYDIARAYAQAECLHRFATHPHYFEADNPHCGTPGCEGWAE